MSILTNQKRLNAKKRRAYVKDGGFHCPYCDSIDVEGQGSTDYNGDEIYDKIECNSCHAKWYDIYKLKGITETDFVGKG